MYIQRYSVEKGNRAGKLLMSIQDIAFLPSGASFSTKYFKGCWDNHIHENCGLSVSRGMLPVKYFCCDKVSFCVSQISWRSPQCHKDEVNLATNSFGDITGLKTVVSVNAHTSTHQINYKAQ